MKLLKTNGYFFEKDSKEFFYLADTAWQLLNVLSEEEIDYYFKVRAKQGFNVVQIVLLTEFDGLKTPNYYGQLPLLEYENDIIPNLEYFEFVRRCIKRANDYGLIVGLLPTWGDKVNKRSGTGPEIFNEKNTYKYAKFVSDFFEKLEIVYFLGGDKNPENEKHYKVFEEFARGIKAGKGKQNLMSYHVKGGYCSNDFYNDSSWLDFSVFQSGHTKYTLSKSDRMKFDHFSPIAFHYTEKERARKHIKPFMDGEPAYENHPQMFVDENGVWGPIRNPELTFFTDYDVRKDAYWSVFGGSAGFTYGANDIWQFTNLENIKYQALSLSMTSWKIALQLSGANQMKYLKKLICEFDDFTRQSAQELLLYQEKKALEDLIVICTDKNACIMAYTPVEQTFTINTSCLNSEQVSYCWFDPKDGTYGKKYVIRNDGQLTLNSPIGLDYVLMIRKEV